MGAGTALPTPASRGALSSVPAFVCLHSCALRSPPPPSPPPPSAAPAEVVKLVVGTKCDADAAATTAVSEAEAQAFATKHGALCERCSAKDGINVSALFTQVAVRIVRNGFDYDGKRKQAQQRGLKAGASKKKGCC